MNRDQRDPYGRLRRRANAAAAAGQSAKRRAQQRAQPPPEFDWDKAIELLRATLADVYGRRPR